MTTPTFFRGSFEVERRWKAAPERVFNAWSDPALKAQWFRGPPGHWTELRRTADFRVGGVEVTEGRFEVTEARFDDGGVTTLFVIRYHVIEPHHRIAYVFDLYLSGAHHSVTLASLNLVPDGDGTHASYSEQITFMNRQDGLEMRREGTEWQFDVIGSIVEAGESTL